MKATVVICTWNRHELLRQTLEGLCAMQDPRQPWELVIVNNNSTDATDDVIASFQQRLPIRRLFEPTPGVSSARNRAVQGAAGEFIVWTDDDVLVDRRWLVAYMEAFERWPRAAVFGGPVAHHFEVEPPRWFTRAWPRLRGAYSILDFGTEPIELNGTLVPYGPNFAVSTAEHKKFRYDSAWGIHPDSNRRGEECRLMRAMLKDGCHGRWVPTARVKHVITREQQTIKYLRSRLEGTGEELGSRSSYDAVPLLFGRPRWLVRTAFTAEVKFWLQRLLCRPEVWVGTMQEASVARGRLREFAAR